MKEEQTKEMIDYLLTELKKYVAVTDEKVSLALKAHGGELADIHRKLKIATRTYELEARDKFAAAALEGLCVQGKAKEVGGKKHLAKVAYQIADAMLEARTVDFER